MGYVGLDRTIYKSFKDIKDSRPLHMLNLVELKEKAIYPDGTILTGVKPTSDTEKRVNQYLRDWEDQLYGEEKC